MTDIVEEFRKTIDWLDTLPPPRRLWFYLGGTGVPDNRATEVSEMLREDIIVCDRRGRAFLRGEEVVTDDLQAP